MASDAERESVREVVESISPSERLRLFQFFCREVQKNYPERDFSQPPPLPLLDRGGPSQRTAVQAEPFEHEPKSKVWRVARGHG